MDTFKVIYQGVDALGTPVVTLDHHTVVEHALWTEGMGNLADRAIAFGVVVDDDGGVYYSIEDEDTGEEWHFSYDLVHDEMVLAD